jgi:TRAP transporter TAXI family solute receptor
MIHMNVRVQKSRLVRIIRSKWFKRWGITLAAFSIALAAAILLVGPPCPDQIVIATGRTDGAYHHYAEKYAAILKSDGVELDVHDSDGSLENLERLERGDATVAFVQGGVADVTKHQDLMSLCSVYSEPVWVFYRRALGEGASFDRSASHSRVNLQDLKGKCLAVGTPGSGTRAVAVQLLKELQVINARDAASIATELKPLGGSHAAEALLNGQVDAAFLVTSAESPVIRRLLESPNIELMSFERAKAFEKRFPFLSSVTLGAGVIDLQANLPRRDIQLLAPTANLVCRRDLHPALVPLLMKAAHRVHEEGGFLDEAGTFPSSGHLDMPISADARRYLKSGPSPFYKYLPFQIAVGLDRTKLFLLPLVTLLIPLLKTAPPIYRWRIRCKIFKWYRGLREIDARLRENDTAWDVSAEIDRLENMEVELSEVSVPLSNMYEFYALRMHVDFVLKKLRHQLGDSTEVNRDMAA